MEAILLPTDFSATAKNAAFYALKLAEQIGVKKLVLYHSYEIPVSIDPLVPGIQMLDIETLKEISETNLARFQIEMQAQANGVTIHIVSEYGSLTAGLDEVCEKNAAGLVVMGITGGGLLEEKLIGSNTLSVAKHTKIPVIIVPANAGGGTADPVSRVLADELTKLLEQRVYIENRGGANGNIGASSRCNTLNARRNDTRADEESVPIPYARVLTSST